MNDNYDPLGNMTYADAIKQKRAAKQLRKQVRKFIRNDLQCRAITGDPSPFKRVEQP